MFAGRSALLPMVVLVAFLAPRAARADHYSGGSITYECLGGNFFEITLDLYLDCSGAALTAQSLQLSNDCGVSFSLNNLPLVLTEEVSQICPSSVANSTCNGGTLQGVRHYQFVTTVFLSPCDDWTIAWNICCRNAVQNLVGTQGMYLEATVNNLGGVCDNSPVIADNSLPFVCVNDPVVYNPGISDPDGNTMQFALISAQFAAPAPTNIGYQPGFTASAPIPGIVLDSNTGQLSFTPTVTGSYVVVMEVTTYNASGVAIGTMMRDFLFVVQNCVTTPPVTTGLTNSTNGFIVSAGAIEVCDGLPFCVDIPFTDADPGSSIVLTTNATALLPGATFTVTGSNPVVGRLCWTPDPAYSPANVFITANDNSCPVPNQASTSVLITVVQPPAIPPDAGTNGTTSACPGSPPVPLFPILGGGPDLGGVWTDPNGVIHNGVFTPPGDPFGIYTYAVGNGCQNDQATVTVSATGGQDPGTDGSLNLCANGAAVALITGLGGTPQAGGTWAGPSTVVGGMYDPVTMLPGAYVHTVPGVGPCPAVSATVTVTENAAPNAGTNGTLTICSNGASTSLFARLGGTPGTGGAWSGPSAVVGGNYDPATMAPGVYTYTVTGTAPCTNATATVTVTENTLPNAGTNGTLTICSNGASTSLFARLGGTPDAGGAWSGPSAVVGGNYDPATMAPGVYTYTVTGTAPCTNATATVTVTENTAPNAGTNGTLTICSNGASTSLFARLGGTPDAGGAWSGPSAVVGGNYDPATMAPGVYTYTVTGTAPCTNATATVTVTENAAPNAGTNGTLTICSNGASTSLFAQLGGTPDAGGTWSGPSAVVGGNYDPATMAPGVYTYTVTGAAPCTNATATVTVTENAAPNAGTNGTLTICSNGASTSLFTQLGGTPDAGGAWSGPSAVVGGNYDPATMAPGVYTYTVTGTAPCTNATATVTVTENTLPNAGTNGTLTICSNGASTSLFAQLGGTPDAGGAWSGPSAVVGGNYDSATMAPGVYTYTVTGTAPCTNATATVTVTENTAPNAGINGTLTVCETGGAVALFTSLGGTPDAGGAWSGPSAVVGGNYDPATMTPGVYTYTVTGTAPCTNATATVMVTENTAPNAGTNGTLTICSNGTSTSLFPQLGGTPDAGGTWSGPSAVVGGSYDPATMAPGVYTYTVTGTAPCTNATATVTVTENTAPNAGINGTLTVCETGGAVALLTSLGGTPDAGGAWSGPSAVVGGNYDPATMAPGVYTYTVTGAAPCTNATATVTVTENAAADAGTNGTLTVCETGSAVALLTSLGGTPDAGGAWSGPSAVVGGNYDPATMAPGVYTYTVTGTVPCNNATATVTVTENAAPNAGTNGTLTVCETGGAVALLTSLGGAPDAGGAWSGPSAVVGGNYDPATMAPGVYTYTVTGTAPCTNATATVTVAETGSPDAGNDGAVTVCENGASIALFAQLGGTPDAGGTWSGPSAVVGDNYDPATMAPGVYTYTLTATAPCVSDQATVTVTENAAADAGTNGTLTVCETGGAVALLTSLGGAPDAGGTWSGPSAVVGGNYDPASMAPGVYTYTVTGAAPCTNATATVTVTETGSPDAGNDGAVTVCENGASIALFAQLGGTPDAGGTWSGPSAVVGGNYDPATMAPGVYTYTLTATAPCVSDQATVTVTENAAADAGTNGTLTVCETGGAVALLTSLGGTPDAGGAWSGPSAVVGGNYDPATMAPGVYTYTVTGTAPCTNATATVTVAETGSPDAGNDGAVTVCENGASIALFIQLGGTPDAGGTWSGPSAVVGGNYDPATMAPGVYTYTLAATAPCLSDQATVTVTENAAADAGTNGTLTVCETGGAVALLTSLGGTPDAGGAWSGPSAVVGGNYDPASMAPGVYTYTVTGAAPCTNATATVTVAETGSPDAGNDGAVTVCENGASIALFAQLGGTPDAGGTWSGPSAVVGGNYDPATMAPGVYTYTVSALAPCQNASSTLTVSEEVQANAGNDAVLQLCSGAEVQDLFQSLGASADGGGLWLGPAGVFDGSFDPGNDASGTYTYTISGTVCPSVSAVVEVTVEDGPDAGGDGAVTLCSSNGVIDLLTVLSGTPDATGSWTNEAGDPVSGMFDPSTSSGGGFTYSVVSSGNCPTDQSIVTVTVNLAPVAGGSGALALCGSGTPVSLFEGLTGTLDTGGSWTAPNGSSHSSVVDPQVDVSGTYTYFVAGLAPCTDATSTVTVLIAAVPDAGGDASAVLCSSANSFILNDMLSGDPDTDGVWRGPDGMVVPATFAPSSGVPGVYSYTVEAMAPCTDDVSLLTIAISTAPDAGSGTSVSICENSDSPIDLFTQLGGTPDSGGTWTDAAGASFDGVFVPGVSVAGPFTYTVDAPPPCLAASATVVVDVIPIPVAEFSVEGAGACTPVTVTLTNTFQGGASCAWVLWNGERIDDCAPVTRTITEGGTYGATLIVDAGNGCGSDTLSVPELFTVFDQPTADFYQVPEVINTLAPEVRFNNTSEDAVVYVWDIAGLATSNEAGPTYTFPAGVGASYTVCLTAFASEQCLDSICRVITVEDGMLVNVPNAFTPDGAPPNDIFKPVVIGVDRAHYRFHVFDRWGQVLFETDDPDAGWNGQFANGTEAPIGVYVWKLMARDRFTTNRIERLGHVTLVR